METGRRGRIGGSRATLGLVDDRLHLQWRGSSFDLTRSVVRHRDDGGRIRFSITAEDGATEAAEYRRRGPTRRDLLMDYVDFTADEPWTWEDSDFGLFVFHVATGTGPMKYRHLLEPTERSMAPRSSWPPDLTDGTLTRRRWNARTEAVGFDDVSEVRVKFEVAGIWSDLAVFTLDADHDFAIVPVGGPGESAWVRTDLLPVLRGLPGWNADTDSRIGRALEYACRMEVGPGRGERLRDWAESPIWSR